jgi:hypothetical protein
LIVITRVLASTLVRELGHAVIACKPEARRRLGKQPDELVLEAVAYVALAGVGLDTRQLEGEDSPEQLRRTAELIDALARRIEQRIAPGREGDAERALELGEAA